MSDANTSTPVERSARGTTEAHIEIAASAEAIWSLVADLDGWGEWNPLYPNMTGKAVVGERLSMTVDVPDLKRQVIDAVVLVADAPRELVYEGRPMAGLVRARRYIEIVPKADGVCEIINGERMGGLLGGLIARLVGANVRRGLDAMNLALKSGAENLR